MQKKQKYSKKSLLKNLLISQSLVAFFATGLFAVEIEGKYLSSNKNKNLLLKQIDNLNDEQRDSFILGRSFFTIPWVEAPSATTARDGLGPLFDANSCVSCHPGNGKGELFSNNNIASRSLIAKASIKSNDSIEHKTILEKNGFVSEPVYGNQISINGVHGVAFEGRVNIEFEEIKVKFPDGEEDILLKPKYSLKDLNYGNLDSNAIISYRIAPSLNGMGLISQISDEEILKNADENDLNNDGISGKANFVYSKISKKYELGRYTSKASVSRLKEQIANAANNDMGLTTTINPNDNCTKTQINCNEAPKPRDKIDLPSDRLDAIDFYIKNIKTYSAKENLEFKKGLELFEAVDCAKCHISSFKLEKGFEIRPYSDFLLHDMGEGLSDGFSEFSASESEFRTIPLWGLALHEKINSKKPRLLHDGRARNFQEAILWHGGEALKSKEKYMNLTKEKRAELINFLEGL